MNKLISLLIFVTFLSCRPEQAPIDFNQSIQAKSGLDVTDILNEDESKEIYYSIEKDENSIDLSVAITGQPRNGRLEECEYNENTLKCLYIPNKDYFGKDEILFNGKDGDFLSKNSSRMTLTILPIPDAPINAQDTIVKVQENQTVNLNLNKVRDVDTSENQLEYRLEKPVTHGKLQNCFSGGKSTGCQYTPDENYIGIDEFEFSAKDETNLKTAQNSYVKIIVMDVPEVGADQNLTLDQYSNRDFVFNSAIDSDSSNIRIKIQKQLQYGKLEGCANPFIACRYTPLNNYFGEDYLTYTVIDEDNNESLSEGRIRFTIRKVDLPPVVGSNQSFDLKMNESKSFVVSQATDKDSASDLLKYEIMAGPKNGTVSNCLGLNNRNCIYTPKNNFSGQDILTYRVKDETNKVSGIATITFNVAKINTAPIIGQSQTVTLIQGIKKKFVANPATDDDLNGLKYKILTYPKNGIVTDCFVADGTCYYTPTGKYFGQDSFTYKVIDNKGLESSGFATVTFDIKKRSAPVVNHTSTQRLTEFSTVRFNVTDATDSDSDTSDLKYIVTKNPLHGKLQNCFSQVGITYCEYKSTKSMAGTDSFEYKVVDEFDLESGIGRVEFVISERLKPVAKGPDSFEIVQDQKLSFNISAGSDPDSQVSDLRYVVETVPKNGNLSNCFVKAGYTGCDYLPRSGFNGTDSFTYRVYDEVNKKSDNIGTVHIKVIAKLPPVVGANQSFNMKQKTVKEIEVHAATDGDSDVNKLEYKVITQPKYGILSGCFLLKGLRKCTYIPSQTYYGKDSFTYKVFDDEGHESQIATVEFDIEQVAVAPNVGLDQSFVTDKNKQITFKVSDAIDEDTSSSQIQYILVSSTNNGQLVSCLGGEGYQECIYIPNNNFVGADKFTYKVKDETGLESTKVATVHINVRQVNERPQVGSDQNFNIMQGVKLTFAVSEASSVSTAHSLLKYEIVDNVKNGSLTNCFLNTGSRQCEYTSNSTYSGLDSFTYKVIDTKTGLESEFKAKVNIQVAAKAKPIVNPEQVISLKQYQYKDFEVIAATDKDSPANQLSYQVVQAPTNGNLENCFIAKGYRGCRYRPNNNFYGNDSFTYKVTDNDGNESESTGLVKIIVERVPLRPTIGANQNEFLNQDETKQIEVNQATDGDSSASQLEYKVVKAPTYGVLENCFMAKGNRSCTYRPNQYYYGTDDFTYKVVDQDGQESESVATVKLIVQQVYQPPVVGADQRVSLIQDSSKSFIVNIATDSDSDVSLLTYKVVTSPSNGRLSNCFGSPSVRSCIYRPNSGYFGVDSMTYEVVDETGMKSATKATVNFNIAKELKKPIAFNGQESLLEGGTIRFQLPQAVDEDSLNGDLRYRVQNSPSFGTISCSSQAGDRECTYTPAEKFNGVDTFTYYVTDESNLNSNIATISFNVEGKVYTGFEEFTQGTSAKVTHADILWVVDNSGSMCNDIEKLKESFNSFISNFLVNGKAPFSFNMKVTTTDGDTRNSDLTSSLAESSFGSFKANFLSDVDTGCRGSGLEKALTWANKTTGFQQGNNALAIYIILSDEREQSTEKSAQEWAHHFQSKKDNPAKVRFYPIIQNDSGNRYETIARLTGGSVKSISSNFDGIMGDIGSTVTNLLGSVLLRGDRKPISGTVKVFINGQEQDSSKWTYSNNAIRFSTAPPEGSKIRVEYDYTNVYTGP